MRRTAAIPSLLLILTGVSVPAAPGAENPPKAAGPTKDGMAFFETYVRPVLAERCYGCHSTQARKLKGELRLDSQAGITKGGEGGPVVVPGDAEKSRLIQAVRWTDPDLAMPPKEKLSPQQIERLEQWVRMGAPDPRTDTARGASTTAKGPD